MDLRIMEFVAGHRIGPITTFARAVMDVGLRGFGVLLIGVFIVALIAQPRLWRAAAVAGSAYFASDALVPALKDLVGRARPPWRLALVHPAGASMPSTHATWSAAIAVGVWLAVEWSSPQHRRIAAAALISGVALLGFCLVYLGSHWLSDVLVGWTLGAAIGVACASVFTGPRLLSRVRR